MGERRLSFPLTRLGLLLMVGSVAVSAFRFYIDFAQKAADLNGRDPPLDRGSVRDHFIHDFLLSGGVAGLLFWVGAVLTGVGIARMVRRFRAG